MRGRCWGGRWRGAALTDAWSLREGWIVTEGDAALPYADGGCLDAGRHGRAHARACHGQGNGRVGRGRAPARARGALLVAWGGTGAWSKGLKRGREPRPQPGP